MFASSIVELLEFTLRTMADELPRGVDAVFLFGETPDNEQSTLRRVAQLFYEGSVGKIAYSTGGVSVAGQPWAPGYRIKLINMGISEDSIVSLSIADKLAHTCSEALTFAAYAKEQSWQKVCVTAAPVHQPRAFLSFVSSILRSCPELKAFSAPGVPLPWTQVALHSQFIESGRRCDLTQNEWERIERYYASGDLVSARQALDYLNNRDK